MAAGLSLLFLLRHPPVAVPPGICYGQSDVALAGSLAGLPDDVARQLTAADSAWHPRDLRIVSSPLSRCLLLAQALAELIGAELATDARLMELDFGEWEMQAYDDLPRQLIDTWAENPWGFTPPGGESGNALRDRVVACLADLSAQAGPAHPVLIVSHAGPLRIIQGHWHGLPQAQWLGIPHATGELKIMNSRQF